MKKIKLFSCISLIVFMSVGFASRSSYTSRPINYSEETTESKKAPEVAAYSSRSDSLTESTNYIGYGYSLVNDKKISDPGSLFLQSPILDISSPEISSKIQKFNSSRTDYKNATYTSAQEIAEAYGQLLAGGIDLNIATIKLDIDAEFNTNSNLTTIAKAEYSYYTIYVKNSTIVLQLETEDLRDLLSSKFKEALYSVNSDSAAENLFNDYGTHLLTGYTQGGVFEMTNYFASDEIDYVKESTVDFNGQVNAAISAVNADVDFDFSQTFEGKDNNSHATNKYKLTTYGGDSFPGLTIDQAFTKYETAFGAGYIYDDWTDSINEEKNLVITDIPETTPMVPLWDLLPLSEDYNEQRRYLTETYAKLCDEAYTKYGQENPDIYPTDINDDMNPDLGTPTIDDIGYDYSVILDDGKRLNSYVDAEIDNEEPELVSAGSEITIDVKSSDMVGKKLHFSVNNPDNLEDFDEDHGYFRIKDSLPNNTVITIDIDSEGVDLGQLKFMVRRNFSGGDGSKENPYLITKAADLQLLANSPDYWDDCFQLVNDIDLQNSPLTTIGNSTTPFSGKFDGNYFTIKNINIDATNSAGNAIGLFGKNTGSITNLTVANDSNETKALDSINSQRNYNFAGGLVGENDGTIQNVRVDNINLDLEYNNPIDESSFNVDDLSMGGLCGKNTGKITDSSASDCRLMVKGQSFYDASCGGLIGENDSTYDLENCYSHDSSVYARSGDVNSTRIQRAFAGGIVAHLKSGKMKNCLAYNFNGEDKTTDTNSRIVSLAYGTDSNNQLVSIAGGLVGYARKNTNLINCVGYSLSNINGLYYVTDGHKPAAGVSNHEGVLLGEYESPVTLSQVYIESAQSVPNYASSYSQEFPNGGLTVSSSVVYSDIKNIDTNGIWLSDDGTDGGKPIIRDVALRIDQFTMDDSNVKKEFFAGERFQVGSLDITGQDSSGNIISISNYKIDSSDFDSSKPGTYKIRIYVYSKVFTYEVNVVEAEPVQLLITNEPSKQDYYVGDSFNPSGLELTAVYEDGSRRVLEDDEYKIDAPVLSKGVNTITFSYGDVENTYQVVAKEHEVEALEIVSLPYTLNYEVGTSQINLTGMQVKAYYKDGKSEIVDNDDCELIYSTISEGTNNILVAYGGYKTASFQVTGYFDVDITTINNFVSVVDSISSAADLSSKARLINQALDLKEQIGYYSDDAYDAAVDKLNEEIDEYNQLVDAINDDFGSFFQF